METKKQTRKSYAPNGQRSQIRQTIMIDVDNVDTLSSHSNKSRYINDLIARDRQKSVGTNGRFIVRQNDGKGAPKYIASFADIHDAMLYTNAVEKHRLDGFSREGWPEDYTEDGKIVRLEVVDCEWVSSEETPLTTEKAVVARSIFMYR